MGKQNFPAIYKGAVQALGNRPDITISSHCDRFDASGNFAGLIIYHTYGSYEWTQRSDQGIAAGTSAKAFHVLIQRTDNWPAHAMRAAGHGRVHDYLYKRYFGWDFRHAKTCCGGFAVLRGETSYSSIFLNEQSAVSKGLMWYSDESKYMSAHEKTIVDLAIEAWKAAGIVPGEELNIVVPIPDAVHTEIIMMAKPAPTKAQLAKGKRLVKEYKMKAMFMMHEEEMMRRQALFEAMAMRRRGFSSGDWSDDDDDFGVDPLQALIARMRM